MDKTKIDGFKVIGITTRTSNTNGQGAQDIGALWQKFMAEGVMQKIPNKVSSEVYSIYTEYEGDYTKPYTVLLGCPVAHLDEIPDGMMGKAFDGGTYTKFVAKGSLSEGIVANEWMKIWETDISRAYTADFEVFGEKAQNPADAEVDIFIALSE